MSVLSSLVQTFKEHPFVPGTMSFEKSLAELGFGPADARAAHAAALFGVVWEDDGSPEYRLDHSITALLAATRAPPLSWEYLPHKRVVIDIPREYSPIFPQNTKVAFQYIEPGAIEEKEGGWEAVSDDGAYVIGIFSSEFIGRWIVTRSSEIGREDSIVVIGDDDQAVLVRNAMRIAINAIAYITEHREAVEQPATRRDGTRGAIRLVRAPKDVVVDREFRSLVRRLVSSSSFDGVRRSLAHLVRGHWRNQPVGEGRQERRLTWVRPHKRGDESLGRVVQRIERLS